MPSPDDALPMRASSLLSQAVERANLTAAQIEILKQVARDSIGPAELFSPPPIERITERLENVEHVIAMILESGKKPADATYKERAHWQQRLAIHARREELLAERHAQYPDCWCFGYGGRGEIGLSAFDPEFTYQGWDGTRRRMPLTAPDALTEAGLPDWTFQEICLDCPDGQALRERVEFGRRIIVRDYRQRRLARRWQRTGIPDNVRQYSLGAYPTPAKITAIEAWYRGEAVRGQTEYRAGLLLAGENQRGKSTIGYLLATRAFDAGQGVLCRTLPDLFGEMTATFDADARQNGDPDAPKAATHEELLTYLKTVWFLMLDDLGTERQSEYTERTLFQILEARKQAGPSLRTVITTNLRSADLAERFGPRNWSRLSGLFARVVIDWPMMGPAAEGLLDIDELVEIA